MTDRKKVQSMKQYEIMCQINADNQYCNVIMQAPNHIDACMEAQRIVRSQIGQNTAVRGCVIVDWREV